MKKKHFIFLGKPGLIYYSWLFIILFLGLIFGYEGTEKINWPAISLVTLFFILFIYTWLNSYFSGDLLKMPYRTKDKINGHVNLIWNWKFCELYRVKVDEMKTYYLFSFNRKKKRSK